MAGRPFQRLPWSCSDSTPPSQCPIAALGEKAYIFGGIMVPGRESRSSRAERSTRRPPPNSRRPPVRPAFPGTLSNPSRPSTLAVSSELRRPPTAAAAARTTRRRSAACNGRRRSISTATARSPGPVATARPPPPHRLARQQQPRQKARHLRGPKALLIAGDRRGSPQQLVNPRVEAPQRRHKLMAHPDCA